MSALVIDNTEYNLPADFTLAQWKQLTEHTANRKKLIAGAFGVDEELLNDLPDDTALLGASIVYRTLYPEHVEPNTKGLLKFKDMTLGQFIDLETYIGLDVKKTIVEIVNTLYEDEITDETPISEIWGALTSYMNYRKLLFTQYEALFGGGGDDDEVIEDTQSKPHNIARQWYNTIMFVADDDLIKANQVVERPVVEVFNYLAYRKTKMMEEFQRARKQQLEAKYKK